MGPSPGVKRPEHDTDHPLPSSTKVKNEYRYIYTISVCVINTFQTTNKMEQMCIKFYQKLGKTCTETYNMIKMTFRGFHEPYSSF